MTTRRLTLLRWLIIAGSSIFLGSLTLSTAYADNGPHGGYTPTTDACAGCHRAHTASTQRLLINTVPNLCFTCHGSVGTGADTNVVDGVYLERDAVLESPVEGVPNQGLRGGGLANALMDTDRDGSSASGAATSTHIIDGSTGTAWGNGPIGSGPGATAFSLSCNSCHDPHGSSTYRILRPIPIASGAGTSAPVPDQNPKTYTVADPANAYIGEDYGSLAAPLGSWCSQCHTRYLAPTGSGHTNSGDPIFTYRHTTTSVSCVICHVAHGTSASMAARSGAVAWPDGTTSPSGNARSSLLRVDNRGVCAYCHVDPSGNVIGGACNVCHGAPPATGAHLAHAGPDGVGYGLTGSFATDSDYQFGCGECHPTDLARHQNGVINVDLSPAAAPAGAIKSQNDTGAAFTSGTCGGVYCHSGAQVTSGPVGLPLTDASGNAILDSHGNLTYDPYTVTTARTYTTTPDWNTGTITTCTACHQFPLTTSYPTVEAGVGNSHQWIDDFGYGNLHAWNMTFDPLSCRTCHYGEITAPNTWSRDAADVTTYDPVPLASRIPHANGQMDVVFDTTNPIVYNTSGGPVNYSLSSATYDPTDKSCSNVGCHQFQTYVQWGTPYRWWLDGECDLCHRIFLPIPSSGGALTTQGTHSKIDFNQFNCTDCHTQPHGGG